MASTKSSGGQSKRGFASMDEDKQREIASKGGKAAHEKGTAHEFTSAEAREAGRKGGEASMAEAAVLLLVAAHPLMRSREAKATSDCR